MNINIIRPVFLILIPIIIVLLILSARYLNHRKAKKRNIIIFRSIIVTLIVLALSGIHLRFSMDNVTNLFLVDLSSSAMDYRDNAEDFIKSYVDIMPDNEDFGVLVFGENVLVDRFVNEHRTYGQIASTPIQSSTNIQNALTSAIGLFPEDTGKRIILISDGQENAGDTRRAISTLRQQNVKMNVLKIDESDQNEVYIDRLRVPDRINHGETFNITVEVKSNVDTSAVITLYSGRNKKGETTVDIQKGDNRFVFQDTQEEGGIQTYRAIIEPVLDTEIRNNEYTTYTRVEATPNILLVEGAPQEGDVLENILMASNLEYTKTNVTGVPRTIGQLTEYKSIILANVHYNDLDESFVNNLPTYVGDYAGGLIVTGGENAFALGNYQDTPLEEVLPVEMELKGEREIPEMAVVFVIDQSGSMSESNGIINNLDLAKEATLEALNTMRDEDYIGVLAFDDAYNWIAPIQHASDKETLSQKINGIQIRGGTSIYPALREAYEKVNETTAQIKHIILLTDGQDGYRAYDGLIEEMNEDNVTLSTVSIGAGADVALLERLAEEGLGRYYHTDLRTDMPRIFAQEIYMSSKEYIVNREFYPRLLYDHLILNQINISEGLPSLYGYIASTLKNNATLLLESDEGDPILSMWQYGLGRSVAWNSDMAGRWSSNYVNWQSNLTLWQNMINWTIENYESETSQANVTIEGNKAIVSYTTQNIDPNIEVEGIVTSEDNEQETITLSRVRPGEYQKEINLEETGFYSFSIREVLEEEIIGYANTAAVMQYPIEYKIFETNQVLDVLVDETNGEFIHTPEDILESEMDSVRSFYDLTNILLMLALLLFVGDIANRRLSLNLRKYFDKIIHSFNTVQKEGIEEKTVQKEQPLEVESAAHKKKKETQKIKTKIKKEKDKKEQKKEEVISTTSMLLNKKNERK
ncbi:von Willebrand factor type A domain-containing protein [Natranaerovirga hydrolytica]|uniref:von Willebrand factor type A domain-containing protein n=1 Tax=Natranaerovirga hydrolytica TaxID=680378 RepID=A0A4R1N3Q4_9FIRM|nr:VWA domain-containing protein [Natranaerovirga hydrolytica]TCK98694.1 von Willebrand factor type A domain-containing protein [Natranaerovirga hydrolytica]